MNVPQTKPVRLQGTTAPLMLLMAVLTSTLGCGSLSCPEGSELVDGRCVETAEGAADLRFCGGSCPDSTPYCDPASGTCVACRTDEQCTDPMFPICDAQACVQCTATNTSVCTGDLLNVNDDGEEGADENAAGSPSALLCNLGTGTCNVDVGPRSICEPCGADAMCEEGSLCMPEWSEEGEVLGHVCLPTLRRPSGNTEPRTSCASVSETFDEYGWSLFDTAGLMSRPGTMMAEDADQASASSRSDAGDMVETSIDGRRAEICRPRLTSCPALLHFVPETKPTCGDEDTPEDQPVDLLECGYPSDSRDSICILEEAECAIPCEYDQECGPGKACVVAITERYGRIRICFLPPPF